MMKPARNGRERRSAAVAAAAVQGVDDRPTFKGTIYVRTVPRPNLLIESGPASGIAMAEEELFPGNSEVDPGAVLGVDDDDDDESGERDCLDAELDISTPAKEEAVKADLVAVNVGAAAAGALLTVDLYYPGETLCGFPLAKARLFKEEENESGKKLVVFVSGSMIDPSETLYLQGIRRSTVKDDIAVVLEQKILGTVARDVVRAGVVEMEPVGYAPRPRRISS